MTFGVDPLAAVALGLAVLGVVGSFVPLLPGAALSLAGVYTYWYSTGYTDPGTLGLAAFTVVGLAVVVVDWFGGAVAAKVGGASDRLALAAGVLGAVGLLVAGPVGLLAGSAGTVFVVEYLGGADRDESLRAAVYTTLGVLATAVMQALLTLGMLVGLVFVVLT